MVDYNYITARILAGGHIASQTQMDAFLKETNVRTIINLQEEQDDSPFLQKYDINSEYFVDYYWYPTPDDHLSKSIYWYSRTASAIYNALHQSSGNVYIHCLAGISRSAAALYFFFRSLGFSEIDTMTLIKMKRPCMEFYYNDFAETALKELEYKLDMNTVGPGPEGTTRFTRK